MSTTWATLSANNSATRCPTAVPLAGHPMDEKPATRVIRTQSRSQKVIGHVFSLPVLPVSPATSIPPAPVVLDGLQDVCGRPRAVRHTD